MHLPQDKWCDDTDPLWQASWSKITQHTSPLTGEASPRSLFHNSSIPQVLIKIYWIIFAKLNGPSNSNYQLLNVTARDVAWWLAFLFKRTFVPPPPPSPDPFPPLLQESKGAKCLNWLERRKKKNTHTHTSPYTYNNCFFLGPLGIKGSGIKRMILLWKWGARLEAHFWATTQEYSWPTHLALWLHQ